MGVLEFKDAKGKEWRAWEIRPEAIHPLTRAEDYLSDCYVIGWLVFETVRGDEKRRLCPYPTAWATARPEQLRELLAKAEKVPPRKLAAEHQVVTGAPPAIQVPPAEDKFDITDLHVIRTFKYPGGRIWTVGVVDRPEDGGPSALRFTAGTRYLDMRPWPKDWADAPDPNLIEMLRNVAPRNATSPDSPRRRNYEMAATGPETASRP